MAEEGQGAGLKALASVWGMVTKRLGLVQPTLYDGRRKVWENLGYPSVAERTAGYYWFRYRYQDVARRIVNAPADSTWQKTPDVFEDTDPEVSTPFEAAWSALQKRLKVYPTLKRLDRISGIGRYGVLLIGARDGRGLDQPLGSLSDQEDVLFLSVYSECHARVSEYEASSSSPRFGMPRFYRICLSADVTGASAAGFTGPSEVTVHWSRVLHVADGLGEDEIFGAPRLEAVLNRLIDLEKIVGGTGEMYWKGAARILQFDVDKDAEFDQTAYAKLSDQIDDLIDQQRNVLKTQGVKANVLASQQPDPSRAMQACIALIAGATEIPQRILIGTEAGKLGSTQDERAWTNRMEERRENFAAPYILQALIDRLVAAGALPMPTTYFAGWQKLQAMNASERAQVGQRLAKAAKDFADAQVAGSNPITEGEFREQIGLPALPPSNSQSQPE